MAAMVGVSSLQLDAFLEARLIIRGLVLNRSSWDRVSPPPFSPSPSALSSNNHAFTHLFNNQD